MFTFLEPYIFSGFLFLTFLAYQLGHLNQLNVLNQLQEERIQLEKIHKNLTFSADYEKQTALRLFKKVEIYNINFLLSKNGLYLS